MNDNKNDAWIKEAATAARQFVMMFNGAMLYGCEHPNVAKNATMFAEHINTIFHGRDLITFIVANGTLMVEDWPLDKSFNIGKILMHFEKIGLSSISFERGVDPNAIVLLISIAGNAANIEERKAEIARAQSAGVIPRVKINYIVFGKIKADEVLVKEGTAPAAGAFAAPPGYQPQAQQYPPPGYPPQAQQYPPPGYPPQAQQYPPPGYPPQAQQYPPQAQQYPPPGQPPQAQYQPQQQPEYRPPQPYQQPAINYDDAFLDDAFLEDAPAPPVTAGSLSRESIAQIEEVLTLSSLIERPKEISAALAEADSGALQNAFGKIRNEIDGSAIGVDTLLHSLHNMKKDLYEAIEVQKATGRVMHSAEAVNKEINDLTSRAIVKLIKDEYKSGKTPLNRLAHAIRRMMPSNAELMQILPSLKEMLLADGMALGDYLELVNMLGLKMESEALSDSLKEAAESMGASVNDLVAAIQSKPEEAARLILLASEVRQGTGEGAPNLSDVLTGYIEDVYAKMGQSGGSAQNSAALKDILTQLEGQLSQQTNISPAVLNDVKQRLTARGLVDNKTQPPKTIKVKMPPESLNPNNLFFLLNNEIKRSIRYSTPFTTVLVTIEKIIRPTGATPPSVDDTVELLPQLFTPVKDLLRDVDLIGTLGNDAPELFIMLPMTGEEGSAIVKNRIVKTTSETTFTSAGQQAALTVKVSSSSPTTNTQDLKSYMMLVRTNHRKEK